MSTIFEIDFSKLTRLLMPPRLRKTRHMAWLQVLMYPVNTLFQQFRRNRDANLYRLKITPQVVYMERLLNDRYDIAGRRIRITDAMSYAAVYIYQEAEAKDHALYMESEARPTYLYTESEIGDSTADFIVMVPAVLSFNENEMTALIDAYKLAGKSYKIQRA